MWSCSMSYLVFSENGTPGTLVCHFACLMLFILLIACLVEEN